MKLDPSGPGGDAGRCPAERVIELLKDLVEMTGPEAVSVSNLLIAELSEDLGSKGTVPPGQGAGNAGVLGQDTRMLGLPSLQRSS